MKRQKVEFQNKEGVTLSAQLEEPVGQLPHNYAVFAHCFTCSKDLLPVKNISRSLTSSGFGVLRFDFSGLGESEGAFEDTSFSSNISDLISAAEYLKENDKTPSMLIGHSLGGAAVLFAAKELDYIKAITTIGAPFDPSHVSHIFAENMCEIEDSGVANVSIGGRPFKIKKEFVDDLYSKKPVENLKKLKGKSLLIMHSPQDTTVGIENAAYIYQYAYHPKSFISLDGANHLLTNKQDSQYAGNVIAEWALRYLDIPEKKPLKTEHKVVVRTNEQGFTTEVLAGNHRFIADEPENVGGGDLGPDPYSLLMSSLGTCTAMTIRMYADRKKWELKEVKVHLEHSKEHAEDCENCNEKDKIDTFKRYIELEGDLDSDQRKKLIEIANKCPVHRTLHSDVKVETMEKESEQV